MEAFAVLDFQMQIKLQKNKRWKKEGFVDPVKSQKTGGCEWGYWKQ